MISMFNTFWLFGGYGYDSVGDLGFLNDFWRYDGTNWTWISGSNLINQIGDYGTILLPAPTNIPGARVNSVNWLDDGHEFWLFGGEGYDSAGDIGYLNDLWRYDGTNWTWISGNNLRNQEGIYGTQGVPAAGNIPGARYFSISWIDSSNNLWLFGGWGYDSLGDLGDLNDLWRYDGTNWTWISGSNVIDQTGVYGTQGVPTAGNIPGTRNNSISWIDTSNNLWLFGGNGYDSAGNIGNLNDLWKYTP
jgi:N-acetylneuraminic acid mutarotase